jgi:hypothetical protein
MINNNSKPIALLGMALLFSIGLRAQSPNFFKKMALYSDLPVYPLNFKVKLLQVLFKGVSEIFWQRV